MNQSQLKANTCRRRQAREKKGVGHDWFWFYIWLVEKVSTDFLAIHKA